MLATMIGTNLCIDEYLYEKCYEYSNGRAYWSCVRNVKDGLNGISDKNCKARAVTTIDSSSGKLMVYIGPEESKHNHSPNPDDDDEEIHVVARPTECLESQKICETSVDNSQEHAAQDCSNSEVNKKFNMAISIHDLMTDRRISLKISNTPITDEENASRSPGVIILGAMNSNLYAYASVQDKGKKVPEGIGTMPTEKEITVIDIDPPDERESAITDSMRIASTPRSFISSNRKPTVSIEEIIQSQEIMPGTRVVARENGRMGGISSSVPTAAVLNDCSSSQSSTTSIYLEGRMGEVIDLVDR